MIKVHNLNLKRGNKQLISNLIIQVKGGDVVVVLGPNGAGKSTLLLALSGLLTDFKGSIRFDDKPIADCTHAELAGLVAWQGELPPTEFGLTVQQRLQLAAADGADKLAEALNYLELEPLKHRALGELSSGERQRVEIAALMMRDCPVWLMDEPTAHLDMKHQVDCLKLIKQQAKKGRLIFTVLHDLQQAATVADMVVILDGKGGVQVGQAQDLLTADKLEPIFKVKLQGSGRNLMPSYNIEGDKYEET
ncbi:ABC transporter ATP-binding protein [Ghiorsea bivora]|uniref:ABC transporter ATP-binding protein n=1 Tax=Ghiorsea bivora TaxID=1485545 RepID=UPI00056EF587|nr:ABC transporter ATP-binding protein [Ghiorsea bivora]